jgi:hypothetical protein
LGWRAINKPKKNKQISSIPTTKSNSSYITKPYKIIV